MKRFVKKMNALRFDMATGLILIGTGVWLLIVLGIVALFIWVAVKLIRRVGPAKPEKKQGETEQAGQGHAEKNEDGEGEA